MQTREIATSELTGGGYLALPDGNGPHPGVVVIHEALGLNDHIKDVTRRLADASFFNDTRPSFDRVAANDLWSRLLNFFGEQLGNRS